MQLENFPSRLMKIIIALIVLGTSACVLAAGEYGTCDYYQKLVATSQYSISSPRYPQNYLKNTSCRWAAEAAPGYKVSLNCQDVRMPVTIGCVGDSISVSTSGRADLRDASKHCGWGAFSAESTGTKLTISLKTSARTVGGRFKCSVKAVPATCQCGTRNHGKIVGGNYTLPNEYPSMAGIVDLRQREIYCGATIISKRYVATAAHCVQRRATSNLGLSVGEHDTTTGSDTPYSVLLRVAQLIIHSQFNEITNDNDIALVRPIRDFTFTKGVQPVCLPFQFIGDSFVSRSVQAVGWGSEEFAGPNSDILKHITLTVVSDGGCNEKQICTLGAGRDTCQSDSGGPIYLYTNNNLYLIGIVSYGFECATTRPSYNVKVTYYLDWILENTKSTIYCNR